MSKLSLELIAATIIDQAKVACSAQHCGVSRTSTIGSEGYPSRCRECPLNLVDHLADAWMGARP